MPHPNFLHSYLAGELEEAPIQAMSDPYKLTRDNPIGDLDAEEMTILSDFNSHRARHLTEAEGTPEVIEYCQQRARDFKEMSAEEQELQTAFVRDEEGCTPESWGDTAW